ncbi:helix-turn-helix transcriptional regulator [Saccharibacillus sp. CPCC 101409]|uniref:helix-turn-helix domain-containing protein n=1 Tax=Saccharibacillus sp. CPCC 101409 TaxID=3058041 RepID=UPI002673D67D|nr:helix-turn-helix transcriptional regulator [Saccharibacillus sp. CPCC 101409]MDO3409896.1 helix-turn-helix transcriptional regulator [Saccharibacillus sp. CPCC 101409]
MSDLAKLIGAQLRAIREAKNLTQEQVAELTGQDGFSKSRVSEIERATKDFQIGTIELIMNALDISPGELFNVQQLYMTQDTEDKKQMVDLHRYMLMERDLEDVKYVVRTTQDFLDAVERNRKKPLP